MGCAFLIRTSPLETEVAASCLALKDLAYWSFWLGLDLSNSLEAHCFAFCFAVPNSCTQEPLSNVSIRFRSCSFINYVLHWSFINCSAVAKQIGVSYR